MMLASGTAAAEMQRLAAQDANGKAEVVAPYHRAEALEKALQWKEAAEVYEKACGEGRRRLFGANGPQHREALMNNLAVLYQRHGPVRQGGAAVTSAAWRSARPSWARTTPTWRHA